MNTRQTLLSIGCIALTITPAAIPKAAHAGTCFVRRVTNTPAPCYLLGTVHALSARDYPLPKAYDQALHDSKRLVFEIKPRPASDFRAKFVRAATYPKGDYVQRHVHPKAWELISVSFRRAGRLGQ